MKNGSPMNPTARIAKNSLVQLAAGVMNKLLGVVLVIYAARQLGTAGFGQYTFVLSMYAIFYIITDFGLGTLTTRDLSKNPENLSIYFGNVMILRMLLSLVAALGMVATVMALGHSTELVYLTAIVALSLFFNSNVDTCSSVFYALERMEMPAMISVVANTFRVTASLGVLVAGGGVFLLLWIHTLASLVNMGLLVWMLFVVARPRFSLDWPFWKRMLREAYPLALANLFSVIYFKVDTVMLASMKGSDQVGLYNAAYRLLEFTLIVPAYYTGAVFPVISASHNANHQRFLLIYRRSVKYMWVASLPLALGVTALAPKMIEVLYGRNYLASILLLRVLIWTLPLIAVNAINAPYLIAMSRQKIVTFLTLAGMIFNIGFNFIAIPRYGTLGAAWLTLLSEVVTVAMFLAVLREPLALTLRMFRHLIRPALAGAVMYGALYLAGSWELGYQIILGGAVYISMLWIGRAFDEVDGELFSRVLRPTENSTTKVTS